MTDPCGRCGTSVTLTVCQFNEPTKESIAYIRDLAEADCQKLNCTYPRDAELDSMSFAAYLRANGATDEAFKTANVWTRAMLGHEPENISALVCELRVSCEASADLDSSS